MKIQEPADSLKVLTEHLNLAPLQEPEPMAFTFETIGWKILALLILLTILALIYLFARNYWRNKYRRAAISRLNSAPAEAQLSTGLVLLKSTAMAVYGRETVATLNGREWFDFLDQKSKGKTRLTAFQEQIDNFIYREMHPSSSVQQQIIAQIKNWILSHRASR